MSKPFISKIRIHPIKSLTPMELTSTTIGNYSLNYDRLFAMVDIDGRFVNGKRTNKVNLLKADYDLNNMIVKLYNKESNEEIEFELREKNEKLNQYLSDFFDVQLRLLENNDGRFMDIPQESSVTVVSKASLEYLQKDLEKYSLENIRLRFRSNLEISNVDPFWEEQLFEKLGVGVKFKVGDVSMIGMTPRARCNVPPQNPSNGEFDYSFAKNMIASRAENLKENNYLQEFGKKPYFLTVNTYIPTSEFGKKINLNDEIEILGPISI